MGAQPAPLRMNYSDLVLYKAYADLRIQTHRTYAGILWWVLEPVLSMAVYYFVFGVILLRGTDPKEFVAFLLIGLIPFRWFTSSISCAANSILECRSLMQQVYFPKTILPMVSSVTVTCKFLIVFGILLAFLWVYGYPASLAYLALPVVLLAQLALILALSFGIAGVVPFLPDLRIIVDTFLTLLLFGSGVFWDVASIQSEQIRFYVDLNPVATLLTAYRSILLHGDWPAFAPLFVIVAVSLLVSLLGAAFIRMNDWNYPKLT